jgi:hypothetical protein
MLERFEGMDVETVSDEIAAPGFECRRQLNTDHGAATEN